MLTYQVWSRICRKFICKIVLASSSGVLVGLSFLFDNVFLITWMAFIPLLVALERATLRESYIIGLVCGLCLSVVATYWMVEFIYNLKGYPYLTCLVLGTILWIYSGHLLAFVALSYTWMRRRSHLSDYLCFPLLVTVFFSAYPLVFPNQLGATQSQFLIALQAIEYSGVYGLDFLLALTNVLLWKCCRDYRLDRSAGIASALIACWFFYGVVALSWWRADEDHWQKMNVGIVQPNDEPSMGIPDAEPGYSLAYPKEMAMTEILAAQGAEVVIWPEARFKGYFRYEHVADAFQYYARDLETSIIFQDVERTVDDVLVKKFNTSVFIDAQGYERAVYRKRKLVALGEHLPVFSDQPWAKPAVRALFGDFFSDFQQGEKTEVYGHNGMTFIPLICYEIMLPRFVAEALPADVGDATLVVQSSNAWFGSSAQPFQHVAASVLRSVELRVPLIHVMNNGPSVVVLPSGRRVFESPYGESGGYIANVFYSGKRQDSFFSRHPNLFIYSLYALLAVLLVWRVVPIKRSLPLAKADVSQC